MEEVDGLGSRDSATSSTLPIVTAFGTQCLPILQELPSHIVECLLRVPGVGSLRVMALSASDRRLLDFERSWWQSATSKQDAIRSSLGISPTSYYLSLRRLQRSHEALAYDPLVVRRLRRRESERRRARYVSDPGLRWRPH